MKFVSILLILSLYHTEASPRCTYRCPSSSTPKKTKRCPRNFSDCACKRGYTKSGGKCRCAQTCPKNSIRKKRVKCPSDKKLHCVCRKGYRMIRQNCFREPQCKNNFVCPRHSRRISGRVCYESIRDCQCKPGFRKMRSLCVKKSDVRNKSSKDKGRRQHNESKLDSSAHEWLSKHNERRKIYHEKYGHKYLPMVWSKHLADSAQSWANELAKSSCASFHHDPNNNYGENLAYLSSSDSKETVMSGWVENEELGQDEPFASENGHMTQVLWRATRHVGCGQARNSEGCNLYVCRYIKPGNCNIGKSNWLRKVMANDSPCGPACPPKPEICIS